MELSHRELCNPKPYPKTHGYKSCTTSIAGQHNHVEILFALVYLFFLFTARKLKSMLKLDLLMDCLCWEEPLVSSVSVLGVVL